MNHPKVYDERIDLANATRRAGKALKEGARLVATLDANKSFTTNNLYYTVVTALMAADGTFLERYRMRRDGRVQGVPYGTDRLMVLNGVPATRSAGEAYIGGVSTEVKEDFQTHLDALTRTQREAAERDGAERRAREFAEHGRVLALSGLKGRLYELPDGSFAVQLGDHTAPLEPVCCRFQAMHLIDNRIRGKVGVPEHSEDCGQVTPK